ncbi:hypothetical protein KIH41_00125 [Litoribacter ruber]|uniref:hypothetical protein n=1 Tax=Litoribacter ruber TaxID=702568 RepID=UPI001BDB627B|nr:hypothetical protein [Litoribacter ruber]MBT0809680.1 hypothetical protein [Litoribacter ruber]
MRISVFIFIVIMLAGCAKSSRYEAKYQLTPKEQDDIILTTIRYIGHLPKKGSHENKFEERFDQYYSQLAKDFTLDAYHKDADGYEYFMASRVAPSLKVKKVATGVKMKRNQIGELEYYEEVFRTWKFEEEELRNKSLMLFSMMIREKDLAPYFPQNSGKEEYIEFPDLYVAYDVDDRIWKMKSQLSSKD